MNVTRNVVEDLLPAYLAGEASADTVALVDAFLRQDQDLARKVEGLRGNPMPDLSVVLQPTQEKEALDRTRKLLRWRGVLMGVGLSMSLTPLSFRFGSGRIEWIFLDGPPAASAVVIAAALACWGGFFYVRGRLQGTSL